MRRLIGQSRIVVTCSIVGVVSSSSFWKKALALFVKRLYRYTHISQEQQASGQTSKLPIALLTEMDSESVKKKKQLLKMLINRFPSSWHLTMWPAKGTRNRRSLSITKNRQIRINKRTLLTKSWLTKTSIKYYLGLVRLVLALKAARRPLVSSPRWVILRKVNSYNKSNSSKLWFRRAKAMNSSIRTFFSKKGNQPQVTPSSKSLEVGRACDIRQLSVE